MGDGHLLHFRLNLEVVIGVLLYVLLVVVLSYHVLLKWLIVLMGPLINQWLYYVLTHPPVLQYLHQLLRIVVGYVLLFVDMWVHLFDKRVGLLYVRLSFLLVAFFVMHLGLMQASLATLSKCFLTVADTALIRLQTGVGEIVFYEVLLESEPFATLIADVVLDSFVYFHVSLETVLGLENLVAIEDITSEFFS